MKKKKSELINPIDALTKSAPSFFENEAVVSEETTETEVTFVSNNMATVDTLFYQSQVQTSIESSFDLQEKDFIRNQRQGFCIEQYNFMISFEAGNQIMEVPDIYLVPNAPQWFLGVSHVNGQTVPVFDLKKYFDEDNIDIHTDNTVLSKRQSSRPMLFIIGHLENVVGLIIEGLPQRLDLTEVEKQLDFVIPDMLQSYINEVYLLDGKIWYDLNCMDFLDDIESRLER